ncbi:DUF4230 domain-containing protein [Streptococcus suis]|uniref:DUF4230 domain-containing protein n=1 Tax=Streptococcus suis TaxID=1307 RepID=UPI001ABEE74A|nr:DUF4230 domain-containing protein [Streptococcus suis]MBO3756372.1 DUF4230 domain-containing protein [Streptococcus suis]WNN03668.1 DUF4230 domain-containing protein [Streptococcus suis]WNN11329.1 DUF4230 domain-containing protein [Streptococcus suis]WNO79688.1 DUF4230 domain-containing protein [Streptococcus suis]HEL1999894.1 DUF4230 domain-containing protein [Streptococcus suis]
MKIIKLFFSIKVYLWLVLSFLLLLCGVWRYGYISGEKSNQQEVSVHTAIESVEQVNELVFLNTAVQKIVTAKNYTVLFGQEMPFSEKSALLIIKYKAKFGIKSPVSIEHLSENRYKITLPAFEVIGLELDAEEPYTLYDKSGEILSFATEEIDTAQLITDEFQSAEQETFLADYQEDIKESAKNYYQNLFNAISPEIQLEFVFKE